MNAGLPIVAVVGRPNVGKSTLFNRIVGERLAVVVERGVLPQRLRDALRDAAVQLPVDDRRVDDVADVVHRDVAEQRRLPGLGVHLHHRGVRAERVHEVRRVEERRRLEAEQS